MGKINFSKIVKDVQIAITKHSPEILTGLGIAGMFSAIVMAVRATPKAMILIDDEIQERAYKQETEGATIPFKATDYVKTAWKCYIPTALTGLMSAGCLIAATSVNLRRNAALVTAYTLSESTLREYQAKVVETIGNKKEQAVRDAVAKDKVEKNPPKENEIIVTEKGNTLCFDSISGRYFKTDVNRLHKAENEINRRLYDETFVLLNEFYEELGLRGTKIGRDMGWSIDKGRGKMELTIRATLSEDETPCLSIDYDVYPIYC